MDADWLIVGAGFSGCTLAERIASQLNLRVLLVDGRPHLGGNAYDRKEVGGLLVHEYGPHIFHTNSAKVWSYLSQFTGWEMYFHTVRAFVDGRYVPLPFNLNSLYEVFPQRLASRLESRLIRRFGFGAHVPILELKGQTQSETDLALLADYVYVNVFLRYTKKQWGVAPDQLDASVTARVPIRLSRDDRYFRDVYQAMPSDGYTAMFERMVQHRNIQLELGVTCSPSDVAHAAVRYGVIYTGPIDALCSYKYGPLPYRSLKFETGVHDREWYQQWTTVNYPNEFDFTRITDMKHFYPRRTKSTITVTEYPMEYEPGVTEPYYPVPQKANRDLHKRYDGDVAAMSPRVLLCGRLADYQYYNMDQAVARALSVFEHQVSSRQRL